MCGFLDGSLGEGRGFGIFLLRDDGGKMRYSFVGELPEEPSPPVFASCKSTVTPP
jgi:hypothetical protein